MPLLFICLLFLLLLLLFQNMIKISLMHFCCFLCKNVRVFRKFESTLVDMYFQYWFIETLAFAKFQESKKQCQLVLG